MVSGTNFHMNQIAGSVSIAYRKKVPDGIIVLIKIGLVSVMKNPVVISEKLPMDTANPLIRVGKISLIMTHTIGPNEKAKLAT